MVHDLLLGSPPIIDSNIMTPEPEDYDGERSEKAFVDFLNEKCGAQRAVGGGLNDEVGILSVGALILVY